MSSFIRENDEAILDRWDALACELPASASLSHDALRDAFAAVTHDIARRLEGGTDEPPLALEEHVLQRAELGMACGGVTAELLALRDAIEATWPSSHQVDARGALMALREVVDGMVLATIDRFSSVRARVMDAVETVLQGYPAETVDETMAGVLEALLSGIEGVDTATILLLDGDDLCVRAAVGLDEASKDFRLRIGEGFAGRIAAERRPLALREASDDPLVISPALTRSGVRALYGVPLVHGEELFGVAHIGSLTSSELTEATRSLFRVLMGRVTGVLYQEALKERLELERARYEAVVENAPTIIFSKDLDGRYLSINRRALAEIGYTPEDFVGQTDAQILPRDAAERLRANDARVVATRSTIEREEQIPGSRGLRTFLTIKFPIVDRQGRVVAVGGVATNITERRKWEQRQQLLADVGGVLASPLGLQVALQQLLRGVVPAFADGSTVELEELDGVSRPVEVHPVERADLPDDHVLSVPLAAGKRPLGKWIFRRSASRPPFDEADDELCAELAWRTSLALENVHLYDLSQRAIRERDHVLGVVAHDLRNPLHQIVLATRAGNLGEIDRAVRRMRRLVMDLVDRHAIEHGKLTMDPRSLPAGELIRDAVDDQRRMLVSAGQELVVQLSGPLPEVVADEDRIRQVFQNLVDNAAKFTAPGGTVTVEAQVAGDEVVICVRDTGPGIDEEILPHVFDRFWQARRADRRGVGLGLAICKGIIEAHGGRVWARNASQGGAELCFTLPATS